MEQNASASIAAVVCDNSHGLSTLDGLVRSLSRAYAETFQMLVIALIIFLISGSIVAYTAYQIYNLYKEWKAKMVSPDKKADAAASQYQRDNFTYKDSSELPEAPQANKIAERMNKINTLYKEYNKAVAKHALRKDEDPDGLMDKSIVDAKDDNYVYPKDEKRIRRNEGNEFVRITW
jgi:lipopolysaccharide export LptBFGC system permease protein LptF